MTWSRLAAGHWIALIGAIALLFALAPDWYTDKVGEQDRLLQHENIPGVDNPTPSDSTIEGEQAETHEKNAWQANAAVDRLILLVLLGTAGLAIAAALTRAYGREVGPPTLSAYATLVGIVGVALVIYRILQPPGENDLAIVKAGAPLGLVCVALTALGSRLATLAERDAPRPVVSGEPADQPVAGAPPPEAPAR